LLGIYLFAAANVVIATCLLVLHRDALDWLIRTIRARLHACEADRPACVFAGLSLALVLGGVVVLYTVGASRDYRVLAPHLLLALLLLVPGPGWRLVVGIACLNLLFAPAFLTEFVFLHRERLNPEPELVDLSPYLEYDPGADPWGNTLLVPDLLAWPKLEVPAGVGISIVVNSGYRKPSEWAPHRPVWSRYLLMSNVKAESWEDCRLELMQETPAGNLYRNLDYRETSLTTRRSDE
jgi:hypothetical protein